MADAIKKEKPVRKNSSFEIVKAKKQLWQSPGVDGWIKILENIAPTTKWKRSDSKTIKALCPFHSETVASFSISLDKGTARCFGCRAYHTDPIDFIAALSGSSYKN